MSNARPPEVANSLSEGQGRRPKGAALTTDRIEDWLAELRHGDEARCDLVQRLRRIVMQACPKARQEFKYGGILFTAASPFCGIFSYTHHVSLEFGRGAELPDKHQVLEGEGKLRRHIKIVTGNDLFTKNVGEYVALGFAAASRLPGKAGQANRSQRVK